MSSPLSYVHRKNFNRASIVDELGCFVNLLVLISNMSIMSEFIVLDIEGPKETVEEVSKKAVLNGLARKEPKQWKLIQLFKAHKTPILISIMGIAFFMTLTFIVTCYFSSCHDINGLDIGPCAKFGM